MARDPRTTGDDADLPGFMLDRRRLVDLDRPIDLEPPLVERGSIGDSIADRVILPPDRDQQRVLGQSVTRHHPAEAARPERSLELRERLRLDRLRAVEGETPVREIKARAILFGRPGDAEVVGEARPTAVGRAGVGHRSKPADRPHREGLRLHQMERNLHQQGRDHEADESHVVVERHPADGPAGSFLATEEVAHREPVRQEIGLGDRDRSRIPGGTRGVLEESHRFGIGPGERVIEDRLHRRAVGLRHGNRGSLVGEAFHAHQQLRGHPIDGLQDAGGREDRGRPTVPHDGGQSFSTAAGPRRMGGDRHASRTQARQEPDHVFDTVSFGDQYRLAGESSVVKRASDHLDFAQELSPAEHQLRTIVPAESRHRVIGGRCRIREEHFRNRSGRRHGRPEG